MASPVQSAFTNKNIHTPLSILVSSPMTEPNYYSRGLNGDSYYSPPPSSPPPPPTGPHPSIAGFNTLTLDTDISPDQKYSESITPKAPITEIRRNSIEDDTSDTISESQLLDDKLTNSTNSENSEKLSISNLRGFGDIGVQAVPETNNKLLSPIKFEGVEYISSSPKTGPCDKETNTEEDFRVDVVMRNMDVTKEEAQEFINSDENEENLCPLISRHNDSYDQLFPHTCDKTTSPIEAREKVIEEYEVKLNDLTLEIYEKQSRLEELELSLTRRERRLEIKENKLVTTVFDNVFHLSVVILIGYASTKLLAVLF